MNADKTQVTRTDWIVLLILLAIGIGLRCIGDVANLQPITAIALFGGFFFSRRFMALIAVLLIMVISDGLKGSFAELGAEYPWQLLATVYLCLLFPVLLGMLIGKGKTALLPLVGKVTALSIVSSLFFFAITNWSMWQFMNLYPMTIAGLGQSYVAGLPFLKAPLIGDLGFSLLFFSTWFALTQTRWAANSDLAKA